MLPQPDALPPPARPFANGQPSAGVQIGPALPSLHVSGFVVTKADLVAVLALYIPGLVDVTMLDPERFVLHTGSGPAPHATQEGSRP